MTLLARASRIREPYTRITVVTLLWPLVLLRLVVVSRWQGWTPTPGMALAMYHIACAGMED